MPSKYELGENGNLQLAMEFLSMSLSLISFISCMHVCERPFSIIYLILWYVSIANIFAMEIELTQFYLH
jgi:hypothetical protein